MKVLFMISRCSQCDEAYSAKDFIEAKKWLCPACAAKVEVEPVKPVEAAHVPASQTVLTSSTDKPKGIQTLVWAK